MITSKLNQLFNPTASGAVFRTLWGALIGMIFLMPLAGAAIDAGADHRARSEKQVLSRLTNGS